MQSKYLKSLQQIFTKTTVVLLHLNTLVLASWLWKSHSGLHASLESVEVYQGLGFHSSSVWAWYYPLLTHQCGFMLLYIPDQGNSSYRSMETPCVCPHVQKHGWVQLALIPSPASTTVTRLGPSKPPSWVIFWIHKPYCAEPVLDVVAAWFLGLLSSVWFPRQQRKCGVACSLAVSQLTLKSPQNGREVYFTSFLLTQKKYGKWLSGFSSSLTHS